MGPDALADRFLGVPPTVMFLVLGLGSARALGALFGLWGLYYVIGAAPVIRAVLAVILSGPMILGRTDELVALVRDTPRTAIVLVPLREAGLGFGLGLLASLPFFAVLAAALVIDQYRGDAAPGLPAPEAQTVGSYAALNVVMALFVFVEIGGFMMVVSVLYDSYAAVPPALGGLGLAADFGSRVGDILQTVMAGVVLFALPVIVLLMLAEFGAAFLFRLVGKINLPSADFLLKNLLFVLAMPVMVYGLARAMEAGFDRAPDPLSLLLDLIGP